MGIVSQLKEEHKCSVCLILNSDVIQNSEDNEAIKLYAEKIFDLELRFEPTVQDVINVIVPNEQPYYELICECIERLNIINLRIVSRIMSNVEKISNVLKNRKQSVINSTLRAIIYLTWGIL